MGGEWACEAYGPEGREIGALCFVADRGVRLCVNAGQCHEVMTEARAQLYQRIQDGASAGDETMAYLAGEFTKSGAAARRIRNGNRSMTRRERIRCISG